MSLDLGRDDHEKKTQIMTEPDLSPAPISPRCSDSGSLEALKEENDKLCAQVARVLKTIAIVKKKHAEELHAAGDKVDRDCISNCISKRRGSTDTPTPSYTPPPSYSFAS
jgi:hypothetical protein